MNEAILGKAEKNLKIILVGGGTGGHIFPALAFGKWLLAHTAIRNVGYISGSRPLEVEIYEANKIQPYYLSLEGSPLGAATWIQKIKRCLRLSKAFFQTLSFFRKEKPDICVLFGGYVSFFPLLCGSLLGIPLIAQEQNAKAGKVTRLASRMGVTIATGWEECGGLAGKSVYTGIPVRDVVFVSRELALTSLRIENLSEDIFVIGVVGGSLSSSTLQALVKNLAESINERLVFLVLGKKESDYPSNVHFVGKQWDMSPFYSACDGVVCRAGASTLAELAVYGIPALAVPWMGAADNHQEANAHCFSKLTSNPIWTEGAQESLKEVFIHFLKHCVFKRKKKTFFG